MLVWGISLTSNENFLRGCLKSQNKCDRHPRPSAAVLDSQSVKTATMIHTEVGYDCAKQIKGAECTARQALEFNSREPGGRLCHVFVDTLGLLIVVVITAANLPERAGAKLVFAQVKKEHSKFWRLVKIWVDGGYRGEEFMKWVMDKYRWIRETILRTDQQKGFKILPRRWVVERTFGWFNWCHRLNKDYEVLPATSETMIRVAMIRLMLRRLA